MELQLLEQMMEMIKFLPLEKQVEEYQKLLEQLIDEKKVKKENCSKGGRPKGSTKKTSTKTITPKVVEEKEEKEEKTSPEINECMELVKSFNNGITNGSEKRERMYAKNLILKIKKIDSVVSGEYSRQQILKIILEIVSKDKYYSPKIASVEQIYYNLGTLQQVCKNTLNKQKQSFNTLTPL